MGDYGPNIALPSSRESYMCVERGLTSVITTLLLFVPGEGRSRRSFPVKVVPGEGRSFLVKEGRCWTRSTPEVVPGQGQLVPGVFPLPSHLFPGIAVTHFQTHQRTKKTNSQFVIYADKSYHDIMSLLHNCQLHLMAII